MKFASELQTTSASHRKHLKGFKQTQNECDISGDDFMYANKYFGKERQEKKLDLKKSKINLIRKFLDIQL